MTSETELHRQIHPKMLLPDGTGPSSLAFLPSEKDDYRYLSVYDGDQVSAKAAFDHYTIQQGLASVGSFSLAVKACEALALSVRPDPAPFPAHVVIDFGPSLTNRQRKTLAKRLRNKGSWTYRQA